MNYRVLNDILGVECEVKVGLIEPENKEHSTDMLMTQNIPDVFRKKNRESLVTATESIMVVAGKKDITANKTQENVVCLYPPKHRKKFRCNRSRRCHWFMAWGDSLL